MVYGLRGEEKRLLLFFFRVFPKQFRLLSTAARLVGQWKVVRYQKMRTSLLLKRVKVSGQKLR